MWNGAWTLWGMPPLLHTIMGPWSGCSNTTVLMYPCAGAPSLTPVFWNVPPLQNVDSSAAPWQNQSLHWFCHWQNPRRGSFKNMGSQPSARDTANVSDKGHRGHTNWCRTSKLLSGRWVASRRNRQKCARETAINTISRFQMQQPTTTRTANVTKESATVAVKDASP